MMRNGMAQGMFRRALVASDLSPASAYVVRFAQGLRGLGVRQVVLLHCLEIREVVPLLAHVETTARHGLASQKESLERAGLDVTVEVIPGLPHTEIGRMAEQHECDLIVIGSHGHNLASVVLLGSKAAQILHQVTRPLLLIRLKRHDGEIVPVRAKPDFLSHVLYPTDFSDNAEHAFRVVRECVTRGARRVTLVHVQDQSRIERHLRDRLEEFNRIDHTRLERLAASLSETGSPRMEIEMPYGAPTREILRLMGERRVSLTVMGTQGRGFIEEVFLGSVSHNVARNASAPVLVVPALR